MRHLTESHTPCLRPSGCPPRLTTHSRSPQSCAKAYIARAQSDAAVVATVAGRKGLASHPGGEQPLPRPVATSICKLPLAMLPDSDLAVPAHSTHSLPPLKPSTRLDAIVNPRVRSCGEYFAQAPDRVSPRASRGLPIFDLQCCHAHARTLSDVRQRPTSELRPDRCGRCCDWPVRRAGMRVGERRPANLGQPGAAQEERTAVVWKPVV